MIEISEPLPDSEPGYKTVHNISLDGKYIGYVDVSYLRQEDVKTFQKYTKRKLKAGQPFGVQVFIDISKGGVKATDIGTQGLLQIVNALKQKLEGLEDRDIFILELEAGRKRPISRGGEIQVPRIPTRE